MSPLAQQLADLKFALQELESAVQQPRDERFSVEQVLDRFPSVLTLLYKILQNVLASQGTEVHSPTEAFIEAHQRGWLRGEVALWLRLLSDYQQLKDEDLQGVRANAMAQDVRACSCILWETYELLTARFRYQTQVQPAQKINGASAGQRFAAVSPM